MTAFVSYPRVRIGGPSAVVAASAPANTQSRNGISVTKATINFRPDRGCTTPNCDRKHVARGLCRTCYSRVQRRGFPPPVGEADASPTPESYTFGLTCAECGSEWTHSRPSQSGRLPLRCRPCQLHRDRTRPASKLPAAIASANMCKARWAKDNPDQVKAARAAWKAAHPERIRADRRARKKRNPIANRSYNRARHARKLGLAVVAFTPEQLRQRLAYYGGRCWMCLAPGATIDHVKPIAKGGAHMLCNLRPACQPCNSRKGANWPWPATASDPRP